MTILDPRVLKRIEKSKADVPSLWSADEAYEYGREDEATRAQKLVEEMRHAMSYYKSCGEESDPEFQLYRSFDKALNEYFGTGDD